MGWYQRRVHGIIISPLFGFYFILAFLPVISSEAGVAFENTIKYFVIQRCASIIFLFGVILCLFISNSFIFLKRIALFFKLGAAPFHGCFISVLFLLSTVQKILPLLIIVNIIVLPRLLIFITFFTILILIFILIYSVLLIGIIFSTDIRSNSSFYQIERLDNFSKIMFIFIFISLGSLPPLLGFLSKLLVLKRLILIIGLSVIVTLVFISLIILYTYISRFFFYLSMIPSIKSRLKINKYKYSKLIFIISVFGINLFMILTI